MSHIADVAKRSGQGPGDRRLPRRSAYLGAAAALTLSLVLAACAGAGGRETGQPPDRTAATTQDESSGESVLVSTYRSPTCGCCEGYERYLEDQGFRVESTAMDDVEEIKDDFAVPQEMRSCHTAVIGEYFIEGHVPVEAIIRLLEEQPAINGIALPGMPSGSPGMGGDKLEPWVIYAITDGAVEEFMTV